ncbi:KH domain-containing, RNA-binding, signal transduction-associated protein 2 [Drosophila nasuta]|uniref:KH domain-containing, RNA-binding, signal transduction-associated protein 2 n=1 Tax=Drosophila albomicans TaxID=7291 RepID=A0A6P8WZA0_DROAB|nr:KH domain-containing, RNA-binding, signal transduction-associated protein 2 [Drosophila albomicans]XP_034103981.1 KH domain-containing, RNA-binding, signal transduction-associated protein 2 [Drosophila albomicans]XP_060659016.1 KH domain-containing, RNA-binding, signal transduction-associated protein 2 [Drosophila nasuta]XP_060659017.1 KH domain-containing, RNA-binding, signal transduction-associated protein 2 [Drosophila nasuta]
MTEKYDGNGDYSAYNEEDSNEYGGGGGKARKSAGNGGGGGPHNGDAGAHDLHGVPEGGASVQLNEKANEYIRDCMAEKNRMDRKFPIAEKLMEGEIEKVQTTGRIPSREQKYADIYREKPLRISQRVLVPIREHPKFNFVGKLLGPKGNSLRRLQEETLCKMTVLGRNSMRDRAKEEELRSSKDPKYAHLNSDLHVEISTIAPPAEAYARIAYAMAELRKYLIPDSNDIIRQEQLRELMDSTSLNDSDSNSKNSYKKVSHMQSSNAIGNSMGGSTNSGAAGAGVAKNMAHHGYRGSQQSSFSKNVLAPKQKVMSILEKARTAMDETYGRGYEDGIAYDPHQSYDAYSYASHGVHGHGHGPPTSILGGVGNVTGVGGGGVRGGHYETADYETDYSRRDYYQHSPGYTGGGGGGGGAAQSNANNAAGLNSNHNRSHVNR